jgi:hypothetical protein
MDPGFETSRLLRFTQNPATTIGAANLYEFVYNSSINKKDSFGLDAASHGNPANPQNPQDCWQSPEDALCGGLTGIKAWCCKKAIAAIFATPGGRKRACQVQESICTTCCGVNYQEDDNMLGICNANCRAKQALCLIGASK